MIDVFSRNENESYHVLNHGDCWVNNFMFKEEADDVIFIDFQEGYYGSPGIDLNYLFCSSMKKETYAQYKDELITEYHTTLSGLLHKLNYTKYIPDIPDIKREMLNKAFHGLATVTATLPVLLNISPELTDPMDFILDSDNSREKRLQFFNNPRYEGLLSLFLEEYIEQNILS